MNTHRPETIVPRGARVPGPSYHGAVWSDAPGPAAYIGRTRPVPPANPGGAPSPSTPTGGPAVTPVVGVGHPDDPVADPDRATPAATA
jgi:hypothetical protein